MRRPGVLLLLLLAVAATAAAQRPEAELRRDLQRTFIHGVSEADARAFASEADAATLLRLLADPSFERPDNAAAFLVHLAGEESVAALAGLARLPLPPGAAPERDRSRLILPQALAGVSERAGAAGIEALVELSEDEALPPELRGLAAGELGRLGVPGFTEPPRLALPARPAAADPAPRVQGIPITYANHVDLEDPMTDERLDLAFLLVNQRVGRSDFEEDLSCCVQLERSGTARSFGSPGDGLDVIDDATEFGAVRTDGAARVKVVRLIRHCFGFDAPNIGGCAEISGDSMVVVRFGSATLEGLVWWHEYGHNTGIAEHDPDDRFIMSAITGFQDTAVSAGQCAKFHDPELGTAISLVDRGVCEDLDGDEVQDGIDNCPGAPNFEQVDQDLDGLGDVCDGDDDGDGVPDDQDRCPGQADGDDSDGDGVPSCLDGCPEDPNKTEPGLCGCGIFDVDADGDGVVNCLDGCPLDPDKLASGDCGCGTPDDDADGDGTADCDDACPADPAKTTAGACGCGTPDDDSDGDGTADCLDGCPADPAKTAPGDCGCGESDEDSDGDGTADCNDGCSSDPSKQAPGDCGCGLPELDADGDTFADCLQCTLGDAWPPEGDGVVGLADWLAFTRLLDAGEAPSRCLDLAPASAACPPAALCVTGGDGLDDDDAALLRGLASGLLALDCDAACEPPPPGASLRLPGDVAPRGGAGAGPEQVGDGAVDVADVLQLLRWAVGLDGAPGAEESLRADVAPAIEGVAAGDFFLDVADVLLVLRVAVGLETLVWELQRSELRVGVDAAAAALLVTVSELPAWVGLEEGALPSCPDSGTPSLDEGAASLALGCLWDPAAAAGPFLDLSFEYRAPAPLPVEGAGAPSLGAAAVDTALAELPAVVELLAD